MLLLHLHIERWTAPDCVKRRGEQDVVKDVLAFAEVAESGTPREGPLSPIHPLPLGQTHSPPGYASPEYT